MDKASSEHKATLQGALEAGGIFKSRGTTHGGGRRHVGCHEGAEELLRGHPSTWQSVERPHSLVVSQGTFKFPGPLAVHLPSMGYAYNPSSFTSSCVHAPMNSIVF